MPKLTFSVFGCSHKTASLSQRESWALDHTQVKSLYERFLKTPFLKECVILNTCNRLEFYTVGLQENPENAIIETINQLLETKLHADHCFYFRQKQAIDHLFKVCSGIDSQIVGENEIFGQVKDAYTTAQKHSAIGSWTHRIFQKSFQAAKWTRTHSLLSKGQVSIGNVVVDLCLRIFDNLKDPQILLLGCGDIGQQTLKCLKSRGAHSITIHSRNAGRAAPLCVAFGAQYANLSQAREKLSHYDIIIGATSAKEPIFSKQELEQALNKRPMHPMIFIDLALPRDFDPAIAKAANTYLYNLEDLAQIANENLQKRSTEIDTCTQFLLEKATHTWEALCNRTYLPQSSLEDNKDPNQLAALLNSPQSNN